MQLSQILSEDRIVVDPTGSVVVSKAGALKLLAELLAPAIGVEAARIEELLVEREELQSTAIGDGVAIPHTAMDDIRGRAAALLLCPNGLEFAAVDGAPAQIIFGVVGPRQATGEHLRVLARVSRLLRAPETRRRLLTSPTPKAAHQLIQQEDHDFQPGGSP